MDHHIRDVKKEAELLIAAGEIDEFELAHNKKHNVIRFRVRGAWRSVSFAKTPRTAYCNNFTRQQIRRVIRTMP
jgi:hypothetical protein